MYYIYAYKDINDNIIYIGSTNNLKHRYRGHKSACYNKNVRHYNIPFYQYLREHGGIDNYKCIVLCIVNDIKLKGLTEQFYIDTYKPKCNVARAYPKTLIPLNTYM